MKKILFLILALLPTLGFAKIGDTTAEAEARWGKPAGTKYDGAFIVYDTAKYRVVQMYNLAGDGKCFVALYYKLDGTQITKPESDRLDAVNVPLGSQFHVVDSGAPGITQWVNQMSDFAILGGLVSIDGKNMYNRGFLTDAGFKFLQAHPELMKGSDMEKDETGGDKAPKKESTTPDFSKMPKATPAPTPVQDETKG